MWWKYIISILLLWCHTRRYDLSKGVRFVVLKSKAFVMLHSGPNYITAQCSTDQTWKWCKIFTCILIWFRITFVVLLRKDNQTGWEKIITVLAMTFLKLWFFVVEAVIDVYHTICFKIVWKNILYDILQYLSLFLFPSAHSFSCSILDENKVQDLASLFAASILMDFWTKWYFKSILRILLLYKLCIYYFYSICCIIHKSCPECC